MSRRPRLLVVSHPAVVPVNQLVYADLVERDWQVDLVVPHRWRHEYGLISPTPLPVLAERFHRLPILCAGRPQRHAYLTRPGALLRRLGPDVVFLEQEPFSVSAFQWARSAHRLGVPFGVQAAENLDRRLPRAVRAWRSWVLRRAAFVAARSDTAAELVRAWGATGDVRLVPHHVPDWPQVTATTSAAFRVGFAGRLVPEKGIDVLAEAVRRLGTGTELVVAGDGPLRGWLHACDLGGATLRHLADLDHANMTEAYAAMDVLVLASRTTDRWAEQFGRVLVEAMWCGVPVIGSDSGEIPWVIQTTGGGRVVPEGDAHALAQALAGFRDDPGVRRAIGERGRRSVVEQFSVRAVGDQLHDVLARSSRRPPRVALVAHGVHDHGGMERACAELLRHTHEEYSYTVVSAELAPELRPLVRRWVRIRVPMRPIPLKFVLFLVRAGLALGRLDVDLVHTVGAIVPNRVDVVSIQHCHAGQLVATGALSPKEMPPLRRLNTTLARSLALVAERWCYRRSRVKRSTVASSSMAAEVQRFYPDLPTVVIPNGVDPISHRRAEWQRDVRRELGTRDTDLVVLFLGGDWYRKRLDLAIEGIAKAKSAGVEVRLLVVGAGDQQAFRKSADGLGIGDFVHFFGRVPVTEYFYQAADVFLLPSTYETFSIVCFEAAASGLPLVIPALHGAGDLVGDDEGGIIVDRDPASIAAALVTLAGDPRKRAALGAEARRRAATYTWERSARATADLYRTMLTEKPG